MGWLILILCFTNVILISEGTISFRSRHGPLRHISPTKGAKHPKSHTITQKLDHFNPSDNRTWSMRYFSNDQFFKRSGPIFVFIGGEWEINFTELMGGHLFEIASQHGGMMFYTEHRYYGQSIPFKNLTVANLKYLSADQALIDLVYFIQKMKETNTNLANSKVVVIGGSYAGTLATWARLKYPYIVDIAYASSAPLRAVADFYEYMEVVGDQIGLQSQECVKTISEAFSQLERKLETAEGIEEMSDRFSMCKTIRTDEPYRSHFLQYVISGTFPFRVKYGTPNRIQAYCQQFLNFTGSSLDKLISLKNFRNITQNITSGLLLDHGYFGSIFDELISYNDVIYIPCVEDYDKFVEEMRNSENNSTARMWIYQICTEFGWFQTLTSKNQPFGNNVDLQYFNHLCTDIYGQAFNKEMLDNAIYRTNLLYGSTKLEITKLISVHGTQDPWHPVGLLHDLNPLAPTIVINGTHHCADLHPVQPDSPPQLREAQKTVQKFISEWLQ